MKDAYTEYDRIIARADALSQDLDALAASPCECPACVSAVAPCVRQGKDRIAVLRGLLAESILKSPENIGKELYAFEGLIRGLELMVIMAEAAITVAHLGYVEMIRDNISAQVASKGLPPALEAIIKQIRKAKEQSEAPAGPSVFSQKKNTDTDMN